MLVKLVGGNDCAVVVKIHKANLPVEGQRFVVPNTVVSAEYGGESLVGMDLRVVTGYISLHNGYTIRTFAVDFDLWNPPVA